MTPEIVGIKIGKTEFKMVQYVDDTTIILDGSRDSLQAALNVLEIYGSLSGLRVNTEKTKIIWIGKRKHSKDKLLISSKLDWGSSEFSLLGINFSVDLERIPQMKYTKALDKARKTMNHWNTRLLTPLGRITIIKSLLVPSFTHLFLSIPTPANILKNLNAELYRFLWNKKNG